MHTQRKKEEKGMRYILIGILYITLMLFGCPMWLSDPAVPTILKALSYQAFHANIFHLAVNCISIWLLFKPGRQGTGRELALGLLVGLLVYPISAKPIVGISNMLFAVVGMRTPSLRSKWWKSGNTIVFLAVNVLLIAVPGISAVTHIASFAAGVLMAVLGRFTRRLDDDIYRATGR